MQIEEQASVLVIGAGIMGSGIAQVAAQAGSNVFLYDALPGAAARAVDKLAAALQGLVAKGKLTAESAQSTLVRIQPVDAIADAASVQLAIEAIVEKLDAKRALFQQLEAVLPPTVILATNTSSISVTAIANGLQRPGQLVGMHFFNPVPLMRLVEVVSGLQTRPDVAAAIAELAERWGKSPVHARSTPGFIVNRIARPYYAEALALLHERALVPAELDACLRGAGFRMGPCELMDLIGHDTNFSVTQSVYEANFFDKRFVPSGLQRELVDGGQLGRKTGQGFYAYPPGVPPRPVLEPEGLVAPGRLEVHGDGRLADLIERALMAAGDSVRTPPLRVRSSPWTGLRVEDARLVLTAGPPAYELAESFDAADVAVFDRPLAGTWSGAIAYAVNQDASAGWQEQVPAWLCLLAAEPVRTADTPGLVVARTVAMLINEAADAVLQGVCTPDGADVAMRLGVNYPAGPFEWLDEWGARGVCALIDSLDALYRGERYRVSPWLRRAAAAGPNPEDRGRSTAAQPDGS